MAVDPINWRREMKKMIGSELAALKDEISQLRADLNTLTELVKILSANRVAEKEREISKSNNATNTPPSNPDSSISKKITPIHSNGNVSKAKTTIINREIHARHAAVFVQTAHNFRSKIKLSAMGKTIDAKSILMIMSMRLTKGTEVTIEAEGYDSRDAVKALINLIDNKFGE